MARVSARVAAITESATLAVDAKAKALKAAGEDVIVFGASREPGLVKVAPARAFASWVKQAAPATSVPAMR